jgi:hypothetical protein
MMVFAATSWALSPGGSEHDDVPWSASSCHHDDASVTARLAARRELRHGTPSAPAHVAGKAVFMPAESFEIKRIVLVMI